MGHMKRLTDSIEFFEYEHLPEFLQDVSRPFADLAHQMEDLLGVGRQKELMMDLLLQAKDCAVRQKLRDKKRADGKR